MSQRNTTTGPVYKTMGPENKTMGPGYNKIAPVYNTMGYVYTHNGPNAKIHIFYIINRK